MVKVKGKFSDVVVSGLSKFSKLSMEQQVAVRMRAEGEKLEVISAALGRPKRTIDDWVLPHGSCYGAVEEYRGYMTERHVERIEEFQERYAKDVEVLWARLKEFGLTDDEGVPAHVKVEALNSALDRLNVPRVTKSDGSLGVSVVTEADRRARFEELGRLRADVDGVRLLKGGKDESEE